MQICFLGTSSGTPTKSRNVSAIALTENQKKNWYLIDCGEGTQHQVLRSSLSLNSLTAIFITHLHGDHCYGLPGLLASASLSNRTNRLLIFGPEGLEDWLKLTISTTDLHLQYEIVVLPLDTLADYEIGQFHISTTRLSHRISSYAYLFTNIHDEVKLDTDKLTHHKIPQGPLWGKLKSGHDIELEGITYKSQDFVHREKNTKKIIICGDNDNPELLSAHSAGCDVLVHEATFTSDMAEQARKVGHCCADTIASFARENGIPNLVLTHFSARYHTQATGKGSIEALRHEAQRNYSGRLFLANDFDRFQLTKDGTLEQINDQSP